MASRKKQFQKQQRKAQRKQEKVRNDDVAIPGEAEQQERENHDPVNYDHEQNDNAENESNDNSGSSSDKEKSDQEEGHDEDQDQVGEIKFIVANDLRKGGFVLLRKGSHPCKLMELKKSKTGKHGGAKIRVVGIDIISGKKYDDIFLSKEHVSVPAVKKVKYDVVGIDKGEYVTLKEVVPAQGVGVEKKMKIDQEGNEIHADLVKKFGAGRASVVVVTTMDAEAIIEVRSG